MTYVNKQISLNKLQYVQYSQVILVYEYTVRRVHFSFAVLFTFYLFTFNLLTCNVVSFKRYSLIVT